MRRSTGVITLAAWISMPRMWQIGSLHTEGDLCKIQRIFKIVTISNFFVSIGVFFSNFLAEITRTITFIDHYRLRRRISPVIAIEFAY